MLKHAVYTLLVLFLFVASHVRGRRVIRAVDHAEKSGCYIVKLRGDTSHDVFERTLQNALNLTDDFEVYAKSEGVFKFFTVKLSKAALEVVRYNCTVQFISAK